MSPIALFRVLFNRHRLILWRESGAWPVGGVAALCGAVLGWVILRSSTDQPEPLLTAGWAAMALGAAWMSSIPLALADRRDGLWICEATAGLPPLHLFASRGSAGGFLFLWFQCCAMSGTVSVVMAGKLFGGWSARSLLVLSPLSVGLGPLLLLLPVAVLAAAPVFLIGRREGLSRLLAGVCLLELGVLVLATLFAGSVRSSPELLSAAFPVLGPVLATSRLQAEDLTPGYAALALLSGTAYALWGVAAAWRSFNDFEGIGGLPQSRDSAFSPPTREPRGVPHAHVEHAIGALILIVVLALCTEPLLRGLNEATRVVVRELGLLLLPTLALATLCRLPFRETFSLRPAHVRVWGGALLLALGSHLLLREVADVVQRMVPPEPETIARLQQQVEGVAGQQGALGTLFVLALVPAIAEEFLFRGLLLRGFSRGFGIAGGVLASGILFGLVHGATARAVPLSIFGILLGLVVVRSGSLGPAILAHAANNACVLGAMFLPGVREWPWVAGEGPVPGAILAGGAVAAAAGWFLIGRSATAPAPVSPTEG